MQHDVTVVGAGLAGSEAAYQLAEGGLRVRLQEMKPAQRTPAQRSDHFAELVCSNSLRSRNVHNAVGLLKQEMARAGSLVLRLAEAHRVPAGDALAVDRVAFGQAITAALHGHPRITVVEGACTAVPPAAAGPTVLATGPLTEARLAADLQRLSGQDGLYFYDAIAPIVAADSIDRSVAFAASRWDKGDGDDYLNCPMSQAQYEAFHAALVAAETMPLHAFEKPKYFAGCMPAEVVAHSGLDALRFGAMKPVGLTDPRTGRWPHAVVQLRKEDVGGQSYNLVGFQTKLKIPAQRALLALIPGLERAEILRYGAIHRNTFLDGPAVLDARMALQGQPHVHVAGQLTGVEGYVESAAHGLLVGLTLAAELRGERLGPPPPCTALGSLWGHVRGHQRRPGVPYEPHNVNWAMFPPPPPGLRKVALKEYRVATAQEALGPWLQRLAGAAAPRPAVDVAYA